MTLEIILEYNLSHIFLQAIENCLKMAGQINMGATLLRVGGTVFDAMLWLVKLITNILDQVNIKVSASLKK